MLLQQLGCLIRIQTSAAQAPNRPHFRPPSPPIKLQVLPTSDILNSDLDKESKAWNNCIGADATMAETSSESGCYIDDPGDPDVAGLGVREPPKTGCPL